MHPNAATPVTEVAFPPLPERTFARAHSLAQHTTPVVFRGLAAQWPAVREWSFARLAAQGPDQPLQLVSGNREQGATRLVHSTLHRYLQSLGDAGARCDDTPYLKEFDLLAAAPQLREDLPHGPLIPRRHLQSLRSWIGPAGSRTGLHCDHLDNLAVQVIGHKRWHFARPGIVERLGRVAAKYDAWAILADTDLGTLASMQGACADDFFSTELGPGDVLHIPAGWWHEVRNLSASLLFGGFHGPTATVLARWARVSARDALHRLGWIAPGNCTCHGASKAPRIAGASRTT